MTPSTYLALDLWMALDLPIDAFDGYYERNGWGTTWAVLLHEVRTMRDSAPCWEPAGNGERCVLLPHGDTMPHMGASDVGQSEPLPVTNAVIQALRRYTR